MSRVELKGVTRRYVRDAPAAVNQVDLDVEDGEFLVLLGPSGCGKTTLLRCLAGLETPDEGAINLGEKAIFDSNTRVSTPTHKRDIGMVFQNYSLWPHMSVLKNVEYPLQSRGVPREKRKQQATKALEMVECGNLLDRLPSALSGGQQQRIAFARAVAAEPRLMLFDEPLSNLDFRLRAQLREEIRGFHRRLGFTALYVTHDQTEALQLGTRVAVMKEGSIEQLGTPEEVFSHPATRYVADFLGISNQISGERRDGRWVVGGQQTSHDSGSIPDGAYVLYLRSSDLALTLPGVATDPNALVLGGAHVVDVLYAGERSTWVLEVADVRLHATAPAHAWSFAVGDEVDVAVPAASVLHYSAASENLCLRADTVASSS